MRRGTCGHVENSPGRRPLPEARLVGRARRFERLLRYDIVIPVPKTRAKIACSIDPDLLARVERLRALTGESRSSVIGRALAMLTDEQARTAEVDRYKEAYREVPESTADERAARRQARQVLSQLAWDDE